METSLNSLAALRTVAPDSAEPKRPTGETTLDQSDFLRLLTAQLTNQDPTEPVDNAEFVSQMAQFSTVTGIEDLNAGLADITSGLNATALTSAAALIGRTATVRIGTNSASTTGTVSAVTAGTDGLRLTVGDAGSVPIEALIGLSS